MNSSLTGRQLPHVAVLVLLFLGAALSTSASANDHRWIVRVGLTYVAVDGHDPHVLTVEGPSGVQTQRMSTESGVGKQLGLRYRRGGKWSWGADLHLFTGSQRLQVGSMAAAAEGTPVTFGITERTFTSSRSDELLYFQRLGDTDISLWTLDVYALRDLTHRSNGRLRLLLGIRNADFDNDSHFVAGVEGTDGSRIDASSNYGRMIGPLLGLVAERERGNHRFEARLTVSAVTGDVELSSMLTDYVGPFTPEGQNIVDQSEFRQSKSVTVPIADLQLEWGYSITQQIALSLGVGVSEWTDVAVPPGVRPSGGLGTLYESSLTLSDLSAAIEFSF